MNTDYPGGQISDAERLRRTSGGARRSARTTCCAATATSASTCAADDRTLRVLAVDEGPFDRHHARHRLPALQGRGPADVRQPALLDQPGQRHQQRHRQLVGRGRARSATWASSPSRSRSAPRGEQDQHGQIRRLQGDLRAAAAASTSRRASPSASSFRPTSQWLLAFDFERIFYDDAPSVNNPLRADLQLRATAFGGQTRANCLGGSNGAGFGWQNVNVWKVGVQYMLNDSWTLRAGYNHTAEPDHVAGRHVQHHRAGRGAEPVVAGHDLSDRPALRGHRFVHVRARTTR